MIQKGYLTHLNLHHFEEIIEDRGDFIVIKLGQGKKTMLKFSRNTWVLAQNHQRWTNQNKIYHGTSWNRLIMGEKKHCTPTIPLLQDWYPMYRSYYIYICFFYYIFTIYVLYIYCIYSVEVTIPS
jgi:hypothetical protein